MDDAMTELDLLDLGRSITTNEVSWFGQVITINFAMVVGIYYFLHRAKLMLKLFAFVAYTMGMLLYLGEILLESGVKIMVLASLQALPHKSAITLEYLGMQSSWVGYTTIVVFNGSFWVLWFGVVYLLFFWRRGKTA
jgi:hypothetical protein